MSIFSRLRASGNTQPGTSSVGDDSVPTASGSLGDLQFQLQVEAVLNDVRPMLHSDGGDIELVEVVGRSVKVKMTGACDGCASAGFTLRLGIEKKLRDEIPDFEDLIPV